MNYQPVIYDGPCEKLIKENIKVNILNMSSES